MKRFLFIAIFAAGACTPGGLIDKGGYRDQGGIQPQASRTHGVAYKILCYDSQEARRREGLPEGAEKPAGPPVRIEDPATYKGGCEEEGESSVFFLFNVVPVTPPLNPEYAIGTAVQKLEGDTMIGMKTWQETHYYSILGRVSVFKVKGLVIKFDNKEPTDSKSDSKDKDKKGDKATDKKDDKTDKKDLKADQKK